MLNALIRFALTYRLLIVFACLATLVYGGYVATQLPIDVLPDLDRPRVVILTECPGMAPEDVESRVTFRLETALLGATGVRDVRSHSVFGLSMVYVEFDWNEPIHRARQIVQERLAAVQGELPAGIRPYLAPIGSIMGQVLLIGLYADRMEAPDAERLMHWRTLADWVIRPRLLQVPGVAQVAVLGGGRKQYQVLVNPEALRDYRVTLQQVVEALSSNNVLASGGFMVRQEQEMPVRIQARLGPGREDILAQLARIPVQAQGSRAVTLGQVARIVEAPQLKRGDAGINGHPAVVLVVIKQPHYDTRRLTDDALRVLAELTPALPADVTLKTDLFQMKRFIDLGIYNVGEALALGALLVLLILFCFLLNFRTTFISMTAIPLSLLLTCLVFRGVEWLSGVPLSLNVMTLGGMAIAIGELVDDAIVDVENIFRRLRENHRSPTPRPAWQVIYQASVEIRSAIVFGTLMVILVFVPLMGLYGIEGRLFKPLAVAYIVSILASLLVSLTVTPVLSYYLLPLAKATHRDQDGPVLRWLKRLARPVIRLSMCHAHAIMGIMIVLVAIAGYLFSQMGASFLPPFDEGSFQINLSLPAGASLDASLRATAVADRMLRQYQMSSEHPDAPILHFVRLTGRAEQDEHVEPVGNTHYILTMNPRRRQDREEIKRQLLHTLQEALPGVDVEVEQPLAHWISHLLSGVSAQIAVKIYGDDLDVLRRVAEQARSALLDVRGLAPPVIEAQRLTSEIHIRPRAERLAEFGLDREYLAQFLETALRGRVVGEILEEQRRYDLVVWLDEPYRQAPEVLQRLVLELPSQRGHVLLQELADIEEDLGPNQISRENGRRRIVVRCNTLARDLAGAVADIQERLRTRLVLPPGYFLELGGQFESQQRAMYVILTLGTVSLVGMFLLLFVLFPSVRLVLQILFALPMAFVGGVLALLLTQQPLTVASWVGFISLGGIATRNGILLLAHYLHLMRYEGEGFTQEMVLRGSLERLAPVLMTALTACLGLFPLVWGGHAPGREILYPVATVIFGGLITSTLCEFLVRPGLFWRFSGSDPLRLARTLPEEQLAPEPETDGPVLGA
ncbi:MAG: CusA/CzcA family heavy metal efflux RND transporter [Gemmataceae bacterium]